MTETWLASFALTLAVELPVCAWVLRERPTPRVLGAATLATALTHPVFWFALPRLIDDYWTYIVVGELSIVVVETGVLAGVLRCDLRDALSASALMNGASYLVGLGIRALFAG